ncbi:MAG: carbohydrate ABC transporter permease [Lachnospiraceae bacterium]|nr:carbohydrate ABC transporter permease [Lachnospiraceae bacterium]
MKAIGKKRTAQDLVFNIVNYTVYGLFTIVCVLPFYYLFINTISANDLVSRGQILLVPKGIHFNNYAEILKMRGLGQAALVSVGRTVLGTAGTLLGTSFLGYALSKQEYWHRKIWYRYVVITMYFNAGIIPWFINMKNLGLTNSFWAYVIPAIVSPFSLILYKTYVENIPSSLEESAAMDGAGYLIRFTRIIIPLSKPILATTAIFAAVGQWNSFTDTLFLMTDSTKFTLQYLLYEYMNEANSLADSLMKMSESGVRVDMSSILTATSVKMTVSMVVVLPILCVYPFFQRFFVNGIMIGSVKG